MRRLFWDLGQGSRPSAVLPGQGRRSTCSSSSTTTSVWPWTGTAGRTRPPALRLANRLTAFWSARGHFSEGRRRLGELLELVPDDDPERVDALNGAAWLATDQGDRASAIPLLDESIERARATHDVGREATALYYRGRARQIIGDPAGGRADIERALELQTDGGDTADLAAALWWAGAAAANEEVNQTYRPQKIRAFLDAWLAPVRTTVGTAAAKLVDEGRRLAPGQAIALGLDDEPEDRWQGGPSASLTRREREIAALVATGLTNREIAGQLYLSVRTVEVHVDHILSKLGFRTRTQLAAWIHQEGLAPRLRSRLT